MEISEWRKGTTYVHVRDYPFYQEYQYVMLEHYRNI